MPFAYEINRLDPGELERGEGSSIRCCAMTGLLADACSQWEDSDIAIHQCGRPSADGCLTANLYHRRQSRFSKPQLRSAGSSRSCKHNINSYGCAYFHIQQTQRKIIIYWIFSLCPPVQYSAQLFWFLPAPETRSSSLAAVAAVW